MSEKTDILKGLAILGVIAIHINGNLFNFFTDGTLIKNVILVFDQLVRFSVPFFVFLSGLSLGAKYLDKKLIVWDFLKRRVFKLLPLYFLWTGIILLITHIIPQWSGFSDSFPFWQVLFMGKADYHLYFVPMIFQLYLLFPIFLLITRKKPFFLLVTAFIFQLVLLWQFPHQIRWSDQEQYIFAGTWVFYFILGIFLAQKTNFPVVSKKFKILLFIAVIGTAVWTVADAFKLIQLRENIIVATRSTKISVYFYSIFLSFGSFISQNFIYKLTDLVKKTLLFIGRKSYLIYLSHTLVIRIIFEPFYNKSTDPFLLVIAGLIVAIGVHLSMLRWTHGQIISDQNRF